MRWLEEFYTHLAGLHEGPQSPYMIPILLMDSETLTKVCKHLERSAKFRWKSADCHKGLQPLYWFARIFVKVTKNLRRVLQTYTKIYNLWHCLQPPEKSAILLEICNLCGGLKTSSEVCKSKQRSAFLL